MADARDTGGDLSQLPKMKRKQDERQLLALPIELVKDSEVAEPAVLAPPAR